MRKAGLDQALLRLVIDAKNDMTFDAATKAVEKIQELIDSELIGKDDVTNVFNITAMSRNEIRFEQRRKLWGESEKTVQQ